jgi:hypothetical protein
MQLAVRVYIDTYRCPFITCAPFCCRQFFIPSPLLTSLRSMIALGPASSCTPRGTVFPSAGKILRGEFESVRPQIAPFLARRLQHILQITQEFEYQAPYLPENTPQPSKSRAEFRRLASKENVKGVLGLVSSPFSSPPTPLSTGIRTRSLRRITLEFFDTT